METGGLKKTLSEVRRVVFHVHNESRQHYNFRTLYVNIENMKAAPCNRLLFCCHHHIQGFVNSSASYIGTETFVCRGRRKLFFQDRQEGGHYTCTYTYFPRKIRLIECNAKCRYLKNLPVKGLCGRCFFFLRLAPLQ
jgi:hypothetical protein